MDIDDADQEGDVKGGEEQDLGRDGERTTPPLDNPTRRFRTLSRLLRLPAYKKTDYTSNQDNRQSSRLNPSNVDRSKAPRLFQNADPTIMLAPLVAALHSSLDQDAFPDDLLRPGGSLEDLSDHATWESQTVAPSGETPVSHLLKSALFDKLNRLLRKLYPNSSRYFQVIGVGPIGRTDWGFFAENKLSFIVELKPQCVSHSLGNSLLEALTSSNLGRKHP